MNQYPTQQLMHPKVVLNPQQLPQPPEFHVPCSVVSKYGPHMLFFLISNIQDRAEASALRRLFFNIMAPNGFMNQDFDKLYKSAMAFLSYRFSVNELQNFQNPVQDVLETADIICSASCANLANIDRNLMQLIPQWQQQDVINDANAYQGISQCVNNHMSAGVQQAAYGYGQPQGGYGQPQQQYGYERPTAANLFNQQQQAPQHTPFTTTTSMLNQQMRQSPHESAVGGRFQAEPVQFQERPSPMTTYAEAMGHGNQHVTPPPYQPPQQQYQAPQPQVQHVQPERVEPVKHQTTVVDDDVYYVYESPTNYIPANAPSDWYPGMEYDITPWFIGRHAYEAQKGIKRMEKRQVVLKLDPNRFEKKPEIKGRVLMDKWGPSNIQRMYPSHNPMKSEAVAYVDKETKDIVIQIEEKADVNFDEHSVPYQKAPVADVFQGKELIQPNQEEDAVIQAKLEEAIKRSQADSNNNGAITELTTAGAIQTTVVRDITLVAANLETLWTEAIKKKSNLEKPPMIYRTYGVVADPVIGVDHNDYILTLSELTSYEDLIAGLKLGAARKISAAVLAMINRSVTNQINDILKMEMCIPNLSIDSFVGDYYDLLAEIKRRFNQEFVDVFRQGSKETIENIFNKVNGIENLLPYNYENGDTIPTTYMCRTVSVTLLDILAAELSISLSKNSSSQLFASENPQLYKIVKTIYDEGVEDNYPFASHYIRTTDGVVLKLTKGYCSIDVYQLTVVSV